MPRNSVTSLRLADLLETPVIQSLRATLNDLALRHGGYGPDEALILLNPVYWCRFAWYRMRRMALDTFNKYLGLDRVVVKDEHEQGLATITMLRNANGDQFRVSCEVGYVTGFETLWSSKVYTRRVFDLMRAELWTIVSAYDTSPQGADDVDQYFDAIDDFQSRWQSYAVSLV